MLRFLHPKWLALHLFVWVSAVAMVFLGRWQLHVSEIKHGDLRNLAYAAQWWIFSAFAIFLWIRVMRDARARYAAAGNDRSVDRPVASPAYASRPGARDGAGGGMSGSDTGTATSQAPAATPYRGYVMPRSDAIVVDDPELVAYNAHLKAMADQDPR